MCTFCLSARALGKEHHTLLLSDPALGTSTTPVVATLLHLRFPDSLQTSRLLEEATHGGVIVGLHWKGNKTYGW